MIKYKFACDSQQNIIDIQTVTKENKSDKFICLGCGNEMISVLHPY
jgi:predicted SprT family Zn-dependent metalloprotease